MTLVTSICTCSRFTIKISFRSIGFKVQFVKVAVRCDASKKLLIVPPPFFRNVLLKNFSIGTRACLQFMAIFDGILMHAASCSHHFPLRMCVHYESHNALDVALLGCVRVQHAQPVRLWVTDVPQASTFRVLHRERVVA